MVSVCVSIRLHGRIALAPGVEAGKIAAAGPAGGVITQP
jgi:hypothetical protein